MEKFDMHCHAKEGSVDARVSIVEYARELKQMGYQGMLITDHDSYRSYRAWETYKKEHPRETFHVIKGIEYDTIDAGHFLVIMPDHVDLRILEIRGLPLMLLIALVHRYGGILGPAHPYGSEFTSAVRASKMPGYRSLLAQCDFIETFNAAETPESNEKAAKLAKILDKPGIGGSDSHLVSGLGTGFTMFDAEITCANDMIRAIKERCAGRVGGISRGQERNRFLTSKTAAVAFQCYNRGLAMAKGRSRSRYWNQAMCR